MSELEAMLAEELRYFDSDAQRASFSSARIAPVACSQSCQYGDESRCWPPSPGGWRARILHRARAPPAPHLPGQLLLLP